MLLDACGVTWDEVEYVADRKGHDLRYCVDFTKMPDGVGLPAGKEFTSGLVETVHWYQENRSWWEPLTCGWPVKGMPLSALAG